MASLDQPAVDPQPANAGVADLYRAIWAWLRGESARQWLVILVEVAFVAAWFLLRTRFDVDARPYLAWTVATAVIAAISPASGLVILAATGPFYEPVTIGRDLGMRHMLVAVLGISVALRLILGGWRRMPWSPAVIFAIGVGALTAIGIAVTFQRFDRDFAEHAARSWLGSVGGAMIVLVVAVWVAGRGVRRALAAAVGAATVAVGLSVVDQLARGTISAGPLAWIGFWKDFGLRLGGAVPSPNGMAALSVVPACVLTAWAVLTDRRDFTSLVLRGIAGAVALALFFAMSLTFSRAALLALFGLAVVVAWRIHRRVGQVILVVGAIGGLALLPSYLALRGQIGAESGAIAPGSLLVATDVLRLQAWDSAFHMWLAQPIIGQGFLAYRELGPAFGDQVLGSPHNEWLRLFAEEGTLTGLFGLVFVVTTLIWLARLRDPVGGGLLAGAAGYFLMASFNNPFLFIQISVVVFTAIGFGLAESVRRRQFGDAAAVTEPIETNEPTQPAESPEPTPLPGPPA